MRAFAVATALVVTLLLGVIALELYRIDRALTTLASPVHAFLAYAEAESARAATETREQRRERFAREQRRFSELLDDALGLPPRQATRPPESSRSTSR